MSMNVGGDSGDEDPVVSEINTTPLVDVMLVLLIIFLITIPVAIETHKVELPKAINVADKSQLKDVNVSVDSKGNVYWNQALTTPETLRKKIAETARIQPQPLVHLRADKSVDYQYVGRVIFAFQRGGVTKIGFVTDPERT